MARTKVNPGARAKQTKAAAPEAYGSLNIASFDRKSEPANWTPLIRGGTVIPRRGGQDPMAAATAEKLQLWATSDPMKLLAELPGLHPSVGLALWNAIRLICPEEGIRLTAVKKNSVRGSKKGPKYVIDEGDTESLNEMFKSQPAEVGGLYGLRGQLATQLLFSGMAAVEGVPGPALTGLSRTFPVESLSVWFDRPIRNADLIAYQYQITPSESAKIRDVVVQPVQGFRGRNLLGMQLVEMPSDTFFTRSIDQAPKNPYGLAPYATALQEVLADLALMQDLRDAVHNAAWPGTDVGVDMPGLYKVAVEVMHISNPKLAADWVMQRFNEVVTYMKTVQPGETIVHHSASKVSRLQAGGFAGLEGVLNFLRQRIVQSLKTLPTLMGISDGGTQNYTSVEWQIYTTGLESLADLVDQLVEQLANLHLRLIGSTSKACVERPKIRTTDALVEANTMNVRLQNAVTMMGLGFESQDELARQITGHGPVGPVMDGFLQSKGPADLSGAEGGKPGGKQQGQGGNVNTQNAPTDEKGGAGKRANKNAGS